MSKKHVTYLDKLIQQKLEAIPRAIEGNAPIERLKEDCSELRVLKDAKECFEIYYSQQPHYSAVIEWIMCKDKKPIDGKEYLISDGEDVTEAQWYDNTKWGGMPYDEYKYYAEKPSPPFCYGSKTNFKI